MTEDNVERDEFGCDAQGYRADGSRLFVSRSVNLPPVKQERTPVLSAARPRETNTSELEGQREAAVPTPAAEITQSLDQLSFQGKHQSDLLGRLVQVSGLMLLWALFPFSNSNYYALLRWVVTATCLVAAWKASAQRRQTWAVVLFLAAALYNPIVPYTMPRREWFSLNLFLAIGLFAFAIGGKSPRDLASAERGSRKHVLRAIKALAIASTIAFAFRALVP